MHYCRSLCGSLRSRGCGGAHPERSLNREDKNPSDTANFIPTLQSNERVDGVKVCDDGSICVSNSPDCDGIGDGICKENATIWLYATVRFDGIEGASLGEGESRLCMTDDDGTNRTEVPLWRFPNLDADGYYMELGDPRWTHTVYDCEPVIQSPTVVNADSDPHARHQDSELRVRQQPRHRGLPTVLRPEAAFPLQDQRGNAS